MSIRQIFPFKFFHYDSYEHPGSGEYIPPKTYKAHDKLWVHYYFTILRIFSTAIYIADNLHMTNLLWTLKKSSKQVSRKSFLCLFDKKDIVL